MGFDKSGFPANTVQERALDSCRFWLHSRSISPDLCEDLLQEAAVQIFLKSRSLDARKGSNGMRYLAEVGKGRIRHYLRDVVPMLRGAVRRKGDHQRPDHCLARLDALSKELAEDRFPSVEEQAFTSMQLGELLRTFDEREWRVMSLHLQGCTYQKIGEEVGLHPATVGEIVRRCKRKARDIRDRE